MNDNKPTLLPEGTVLTTEGKDKILTGKLQRAVVSALVDGDFHSLPAHSVTVSNLVKAMCGVDKYAPQNIYRTLKMLENKGIIRLTKRASGSDLIQYAISSRRTSEMTADGYAIWEYYIDGDLTRYLTDYDAVYSADAVGHVDFVDGIVGAFRLKHSGKVFKSIKPAKADSTRWLIAEFNKPSLFEIATRSYYSRVNDRYGEIPYPLAEQASRGAWQPFFDTLKKNKVISYHDTPQGRVMVWDQRRWVVYSTRLMRQREEIISSWSTK